MKKERSNDLQFHKRLHEVQLTSKHFFQEINALCCLINGNDFDSKAKCYQMEHVVRTIFPSS